jgi:hypothetical protein
MQSRLYPLQYAVIVESPTAGMHVLAPSSLDVRRAGERVFTD